MSGTVKSSGAASNGVARMTIMVRETAGLAVLLSLIGTAALFAGA